MSGSDEVERDLTDTDIKADIHLKINDRISSVESKFKILSFEPAFRNAHDTEKCVEFWKYIDARDDLHPMKSFKFEESKNASASGDGSESSEKNANNYSWGQALEILKYHKLDKLAKVPNTKKDSCKMCSLSCKIDDRYSEEQSFDVAALNDYDPQCKFYADAEINTDFILMVDKETNTDFLSAEEEKQQLLEIEYKKLDEYLEELSKMYQTDITENECICQEDTCVCLFKNENLVQLHSDMDLRPRDKCTCTCGQDRCMCKELRAILVEMEKANAQLDELSELSLELCPCRKATCNCVSDYKEFLETTISIKRFLKENVGSDARLGMPLRCKCSCKQLNCPCQILTNLLNEIDHIMQCANMLGEEDDDSEGTGCPCSDPYCTCLEYMCMHDARLRSCSRGDRVGSLHNIPSINEVSAISFCLCDGSGFEKIKVLDKDENAYVGTTRSNKFYVEQLRKENEKIINDSMKESRDKNDETDNSLYGLCADYDCYSDSQQLLEIGDESMPVYVYDSLQISTNSTVLTKIAEIIEPLIPQNNNVLKTSKCAQKTKS